MPSKREYDKRRRAEKPWRKFYTLKRWQVRRRAQLYHQPLCERCLAEGKTTPASIAHHKERHEGNPEKFWYGELASSCAPCHDAIEQRIERRGYDTTIGTDGRPLDPNHPWNRSAS